MKLTGQTALITGAASGIGKGIATTFAKEGAHVWITDVNAEAGLAAVQEIEQNGGKASFLQLDVSDSTQVKEVVEKIYEQCGQIHILVNNAGIAGAPTPVEMIEDQDWKTMMDIHVNGSFYCLKAVSPLMKKAGYGRIINMSSLASESSLYGFSHYAAAKYALLGLTESSAKELAPYGVTVNAIKPGIIRSALTGGFLEVKEEQIANATPVGKIGSPNDVANAALFLAAPDSSFISGISVIVDGGFRLVTEMDNVMEEFLS